MTTIKLQFCEEGGFLIAEAGDGREICQYAISPESTYAILDIIGNVINLAEPIIGNKIAMVDIKPDDDKPKKKGKGKK